MTTMGGSSAAAGGAGSVGRGFQWDAARNALAAYFPKLNGERHNTRDGTDEAARAAAQERAQVQARWKRLELLAKLMDNAFEIPGTKIRFGLDSVVGLIPGVGDSLTAGISLYIVYEAMQLGATKKQLAMMLGNVAIDWAAGSIPVIGDIFDLSFKANIRNLRMMGIEVGKS